MIIRVTVVLFFIVLLSACREDDTVIDDLLTPCDTINGGTILFPCKTAGLVSIRKPSENLFSETTPILIPPYEIVVPNKYVSDFGNRIQLYGDSSKERLRNLSSCCEIANQIDLNLPEPQLEWEIINRTNVVAAISSKPFDLDGRGKSITNKDDIVWLWYKEWNTGRINEGKRVIKYQDGRGCNSGECNQLDPAPLQNGKLYYWAVWAWSENGVLLEYSSTSIPFIVTPIKPIAVISEKQLNGIWDIDYARETLSQKDVTNSFGLQNIDIFYECNSSSKMYEVKFTTYPKQFSTLKYNNEGMLAVGDSLILYNLKLNCDDRLIGKVEFQNVEVDLAYNRR